jgi:EF hand
MTKKWVAFVSALLLSGTTAVADSWTSNFKVLDSDGNGTISSTEFEANEGKVKLGLFAPTFAEMDKDNNNSIDPDEWASGQRIQKAHATGCKQSSSSWCPCQNHPEKPECQ